MARSGTSMIDLSCSIRLIPKLVSSLRTTGARAAQVAPVLYQKLDHPGHRLCSEWLGSTPVDQDRVMCFGRGR